jgi:hypothetical protein
MQSALRLVPQPEPRFPSRDDNKKAPTGTPGQERTVKQSKLSDAGRVNLTASQTVNRTGDEVHSETYLS